MPVIHTGREKGRRRIAPRTCNSVHVVCVRVVVAGGVLSPLDSASHLRSRAHDWLLTYRTPIAVPFCRRRARVASLSLLPSQINPLLLNSISGSASGTSACGERTAAFVA